MVWLLWTLKILLTALMLLFLGIHFRRVGGVFFVMAPLLIKAIRTDSS